MTKEEKREKQIDEEMNYWWSRLNDADDLWLFSREILNVLEAEKRTKL